MTKEEAIKVLGEEIEDNKKKMDEVSEEALWCELFGAIRAYRMAMTLLELVDKP